MEKQKSAQTSHLKTVTIVLLLIGYPILFFTLSNISKNQNPSSANNQANLAACQAPYQNEQDSANIDLAHLGVGEDTKPMYDALTAAANGLQACRDKYGG